MGCPRQEYWSGLPFPTRGNLPTQRLNLSLLHWQAYSLLLNYQGSPASSCVSPFPSNGNMFTSKSFYFLLGKKINIFLRSDCKTNQNVALGEFLAVQWLQLGIFHCQGQGQSLVGNWDPGSQKKRKKNVALYIYLCFLVSYKWFV